MIENLPTDLKKQMITSRLHNLARQHFDTELDLVQAEANNQTEEVERIKERKIQIENAYTAIHALLETVN